MLVYRLVEPIPGAVFDVPAPSAFCAVKVLARLRGEPDDEGDEIHREAVLVRALERAGFGDPAPVGALLVVQLLLSCWGAIALESTKPIRRVAPKDFREQEVGKLHELRSCLRVNVVPVDDAHAMLPLIGGGFLPLSLAGSGVSSAFRRDSSETAIVSAVMAAWVSFLRTASLKARIWIPAISRIRFCEEVSFMIVLEKPTRRECVVSGVRSTLAPWECGFQRLMAQKRGILCSFTRRSRGLDYHCTSDTGASI